MTELLERQPTFSSADLSSIGWNDPEASASTG